MKIERPAAQTAVPAGEGVAPTPADPAQVRLARDEGSDDLLKHVELLAPRLGVAASLFMALRCRHKETASHSLRVTLTAAAWSLHMGLSDEQRDVVEIAALLHDLGKLGVPDSILLKAGPLTPEEAVVMCRNRRRATDILRESCNSAAVLAIVAAAPAWFDGRFPGVPLAGEQIPLGSRILSIVDAFDAMTHDQPYRAAMTKERALAELARNAGTQFDPKLVKLFADFHREDHTRLHLDVARRWLQSSGALGGIWRPAVMDQLPSTGMDVLFQNKLVDNMRDAAVFVDAKMQILAWNPGAERMTGIAGGAARGRILLPSMVDMRTESGTIALDDESPIEEAICLGEQRLRRLVLKGRDGVDLSVEIHVVPVGGSDGAIMGAAVLLHDVSPELSLEARCQSLHEMATRDPLTNVANRAEFNRVHEMFVVAHLERRRPCSLILTDIDHFKQVNDTYGHPAGDEVLKAFARLLKGSCRSGDLVARYGGEEFVLLCADTPRQVAAVRAESIRRTLSQMAQGHLDGRAVTASFGVTEIQPGDTPSSMVARSDRALYQAKESGRNCVIVIGTGLSGEPGQQEESAAPFRTGKNVILEQDLASPVPMSILIEQLRGFVADHQAEIVTVDENVTRLKIGGGWFFRRRGDRRVPLFVDLAFRDVVQENEDLGKRRVETQIHVSVVLQRARDRRRTDAVDLARQLVASLKSYLMAAENHGQEPTSLGERPGSSGDSK
ncbi:MAG: diguanylate cyclase [Planctomycetia bacterium]|nr:diguanylate cyclase [Planctomycetia bacterium]